MHSKQLSYVADWPALAGCKAQYGQNSCARYNSNCDPTNQWETYSSPLMMLYLYLKSLLWRSFCNPCYKSGTRYLYLCANIAAAFKMKTSFDTSRCLRVSILWEQRNRDCAQGLVNRLKHSCFLLLALSISTWTLSVIVISQVKWEGVCGLPQPSTWMCGSCFLWGKKTSSLHPVFYSLQSGM